jgi:hypothetical protein
MRRIKQGQAAEVSSAATLSQRLQTDAQATRHAHFRRLSHDASSSNMLRQQQQQHATPAANATCYACSSNMLRQPQQHATPAAATWAEVARLGGSDRFP